MTSGEQNAASQPAPTQPRVAVTHSGPEPKSIEQIAAEHRAELGDIIKAQGEAHNRAEVKRGEFDPQAAARSAGHASDWVYGGHQVPAEAGPSVYIQAPDLPVDTGPEPAPDSRPFLPEGIWPRGEISRTAEERRE
ncbi:Uu.00g039860.m01.CDS01 [Anthostomella pinea]|uniref:Uu.00g039860.m01.CDS01 n=1 Tax=Anthostomella pinea TaxID=933095 RepID=A0AAI8VA73_9PEZI|nr:Uu.00g039860.m01.CDS01 [Anthostomella pinea]